MRHSRPLLQSHPELLVLETPGPCCEYRVENWHLARDGRTVRGTSGLTWRDALFVTVASMLWPSVPSHAVIRLAIAIVVLGIIYTKCTQILWESVLVMPPHGIQLETHRGFPPYPLFASRSFIPLTAFQNLIINEGLRRWDVRYYMAILRRRSDGAASLEVMFSNLLPHFPVLLEVYHGVQEFLGKHSDDPERYWCDLLHVQ